MSAGGFSEVDHDLLADYVGGALEGTPEEATVARLVTEDPAWSEAYALLAAAVAGVRADLAGWGESPEPMPAAVTDRILAALAAQPVDVPSDETPADPTAATGSRAVSAEPDTAAAPAVVPAQPVGGSGRRPAGVPRSEPGRGAATGPGRRRRRFTRLAGPVAVAAVSIAAVGLGVNQLAGNRSEDGAAGTALSDSAEGRTAPEAAGPAAAGASGAQQRSGTDYTPETLGGLSTLKAVPFGSGAPARVDAEGGRMAAPGGLDRLADQAALTACLGDIGTEHGAGPLVVEVVDYARFQGQPALVVRFTDNSGARWAWVSGPECGVPGSGADTRYRTRVG
ncbi:hypothetical protein Q3W71_28180 [Micromonospora sp. C28SCA-DRY-2]|uniref:hypothetical protein n=1 Tax=Micromonospora sp. C28SCA-DRY-2 TaxID=3059522 RepID=UPI002676D61E|nr:hypothetical protein [Micromonospora sp. C28SCA-DRY-2]MDO3705553.1 hypothetical protein [Micromonospora sp. C28SCA-DRY-2]